MADIINIGEARLERVHKGFCQHKRLAYDPANEHIECRDCKLPVQPFKAFMILLENYRREVSSLDTRRKELAELEERSEKHLLKATRKVDSAWRRKGLLPTCPHCNQGIAPEDGFGSGMVSRTVEMERRRFKEKEKCSK